MKNIFLAILSLVLVAGCSHKNGTVDTFSLENSGNGERPLLVDGAIVVEEKTGEVAEEPAPDEEEAPPQADAPPRNRRGNNRPGNPGNLRLIGGEPAPINRNLISDPIVNLRLLDDPQSQPVTDDTPVAPRPSGDDFIIVEPASYLASPEPAEAPVPQRAPQQAPQQESPPEVSDRSEVLVNRIEVEMEIDSSDWFVENSLFLDFFSRTEENIAGPALPGHSIALPFVYDGAKTYHFDIHLEEGLPVGDFDFLRLRNASPARRDRRLALRGFHISLFDGPQITAIRFDIRRDKLNMLLYRNVFVIFPRLGWLRENLIARNPWAFPQLFRARFRTAPIGGAGTDVRVDLQLSGSERPNLPEARTRWNRLGQPWNENWDPFEQGEVDAIPLCYGETNQEGTEWSTRMAGDRVERCFPSEGSDVAYPGELREVKIETYETDHNYPEWALDWFALDMWLPQINKYVTLLYNDLPPEREWITPAVPLTNHSRAFSLDYLVGFIP